MRALILTFLLLAPALALWPTLSGHWPVAILILFVSHMMLLYPTLRATSSWLGPVVTRFDTAEEEVWLTIDDGPDPVDTPVILELLAAHGARATFFVKGTRLAANPELGRKILEAGHTIGNHSWSHPSGTFWRLPPNRIRDEIERCSAVIAEVSGARPVLFRAPVGMKNIFVHPLLTELSMRLVAWSARGFDGVAGNPPAIVARIERSLSPGAIVLLHEGRILRDGSRPCQEVMRQLLSSLTAKGYRCVIPGEKALK